MEIVSRHLQRYLCRLTVEDRRRARMRSRVLLSAIKFGKPAAENLALDGWYHRARLLRRRWHERQAGACLARVARERRVDLSTSAVRAQRHRRRWAIMTLLIEKAAVHNM